jgi:phospholipid transport system transporter-binding protein
MTGASPASGLRRESSGHWVLQGDLTQATVPQIHREVAAGPHLSGDLLLDLAAVERIDSAALALLLSIARRVRASGGRLDIRTAPPGLVALAGISGVAALLGLAPASGALHP